MKNSKKSRSIKKDRNGRIISNEKKANALEIVNEWGPMSFWAVRFLTVR